MFVFVSDRCFFDENQQVLVEYNVGSKLNSILTAEQQSEMIDLIMSPNSILVECVFHKIMQDGHDRHRDFVWLSMVSLRAKDVFQFSHTALSKCLIVSHFGINQIIQMLSCSKTLNSNWIVLNIEIFWTSARRWRKSYTIDTAPSAQAIRYLHLDSWSFDLLDCLSPLEYLQWVS